MIETESESLILREMEPGDIEDLASILQDERVMYAYNGAFSTKGTMVWMQKQLKCYAEYGVGLWRLFLKRLRKNDRSMRHYNAGVQQRAGS